ncbi:hypothetical protein JR316_0000245 [Psilocybe cubensis]|uniref:Uncharacterized protein n=2 Tax=Psilocybe cubensis TaxID=181762 RepID=A0ACB8HE74_PSICU|nr:hypothetical protein JR316_0000245 [Psilocybe cubensis]KAH9486181.1 hypothetical protein JR316_0000245 [Psilocybe cubensis]
MSYSHVMDEIFAERNARFEQYGIHEKREQWNAYNELLRSTFEECIEHIKRPRAVKSFQYWSDLPDDNKKKFILEIYAWEENNQAERNGKYLPSLLRVRMWNEIQVYLQFAVARRNDTTRTGAPLVYYSLEDSHKDFHRKLDKLERRNKAAAEKELNDPRRESQAVFHRNLR